MAPSMTHFHPTPTLYIPFVLMMAVEGLQHGGLVHYLEFEQNGIQWLQSIGKLSV